VASPHRAEPEESFPRFPALVYAFWNDASVPQSTP